MESWERKQKEVEKLFENKELAEAIENRKIAYIALTGSQYYGLEEPKSDYDFKVFVLPTFDDLYNNKEITKSIKIDGNDVDIKDIRKLEELIEKGSTPYIEAISSPYHFGSKEYVDFFENQYPRINIKKYAHSMLGMAHQKYEAIEKDYPTLKTNEGYNRRIKYGFDTKQLLHMYRLEMNMSKLTKSIQANENANDSFFGQRPFIVDDLDKAINNVDLNSNGKTIKDYFGSTKDWFLFVKQNGLELDKDKALDKGEIILGDMADMVNVIDKYYNEPKIDIKKDKKYWNSLKELNKKVIMENITNKD